MEANIIVEPNDVLLSARLFFDVDAAAAAVWIGDPVAVDEVVLVVVGVAVVLVVLTTAVDVVVLEMEVLVLVFKATVATAMEVTFPVFELSVF